MPEKPPSLRVVGTAAAATAEPGPVAGQARLDSRALFQGRREIVIEHDGADYRLRLTSNGKLILTK